MASTRKPGAGRKGNKPARVIDLEANEPQETGTPGRKPNDGKVVSQSAAEGANQNRSEQPETSEVEGAEKQTSASREKQSGDGIPKNGGGTGENSAPPPPATPSGKSGSSFGALLLSAVLGGGVALGGAGLMGESGALRSVPLIGGLFPAGNEHKALEDEVAKLRQQVAELSNAPTSIDPDIDARLGAMESRLAGLGEGSSDSQTVRALEAANAAQAEVASLSERLEQLGQRLLETGTGEPVDIDALKAALAGDIEQLNAKVAALETAIESGEPGADAANFSDIRERISGLSQTVGEIEAGNDKLSESLSAIGDRLNQVEATLAERILPSMESVEQAAVAAGESRKIARSVSARSLSSVLENGGAFASELASAQALLGGTADISGLEDLARTGIPSKQELAVGFEPVADNIIALQNGNREEMGVLERFMSSAQSLVKVRPAGPVKGDGDVAVVSRMMAALDDGDVAKSLEERKGLSEPALAASAEWASDAQDYLTAEQMINGLVAQLGDDAGQEE